MFFEKYECDIASHVDDNAPHTYDLDLYSLKQAKKLYRVSVHMV